MLAKRSFNGGKNNLSSRIIKKNSDDPRGASNVYIKIADNAEVLPCYTQVLTKWSEEGVSIKDLDQLQQELEKLLNICAIRRRTFASDIEQIDRTDDGKVEKKAKPVERVNENLKLISPPSPKIRKIEEKRYIKKPKATHKLVKNIYDAEVTKFWLSVDPYCTSVSRDDIAFIDELIEECDVEVNVKIPPLGSHYSLNWNNETLTDQLHHKVNFQSSKNKILSLFMDESLSSLYKAHRNILSNNEETNYSSILPLASALIEEKNANEKSEKNKDLGLEQLGGSNVCLDKRVRKELVDLGILNSFEEKCIAAQGAYNDDDQILEEIEQCQKELITVNNHNKRELNNLRYLIEQDLIRQELNDKLDRVDNQVMDILNRLLKVAEKGDDRSDERNKIEWDAVKIIQLQRALHKEAMEINDVRL